jgi:hypothetical protein
MIKVSQIAGVKPAVRKAGLVQRAVWIQVPLEKRSATSADASRITPS